MGWHAVGVGIVGVVVVGCVKSTSPTVVRAQPIHPELQCPAGTVGAGAAPPAGNEAWCEIRPPVGAAVRQGPSLTWHDSGQKESQGAFDQGVRTGPWLVWHPNGQLSEQGPYVGGVKEGFWTTWDSLGRTLSEGRYASGERDGNWTFWNLQDQTRTEGRYQVGKREGQWVDYSPEGEAVRQRTFRNDRQLDIRNLR